MMINISIISLTNDVKKREKLLHQLEGFPDDFIKIVDAVNGKELLASEYFKLFRCKGSRWTVRKILTPSELGCFLSHKKALEEFIISENDWLIVLEDDVTISNKFDNDFISNISTLNTDNIYILGGQDGLNCFNRVLLKKTKNLEFKKTIFGTHRWICRTCCYLLHRSSAEKILNIMKKDTFAIDDWPYIIKKAKISSLQYVNYIHHPIDLSNSTIESERVFLNGD
ncbi:glycosyltransferase family 25 protein [Photobacterium phosphoreum]|uniref:glycosyltransferase family 25 protein n=1 Tax=Photobacterium phosphoreum TaxID=659 RepID=UPI0039B117FF